MGGDATTSLCLDTEASGQPEGATPIASWGSVLVAGRVEVTQPSLVAPVPPSPHTQLTRQALS